MSQPAPLPAPPSSLPLFWVTFNWIQFVPNPKDKSRLDNFVAPTKSRPSRFAIMELPERIAANKRFATSILTAVSGIVGLVSTIVSLPSTERFGVKSLIVLVVVILSTVVTYFLTESDIPLDRNAKRIIEDILTIGRLSLGEHYRFNVMIPDASKNLPVQQQYFHIVAQVGLGDPQNYFNRIKLSSVGAGKAYVENEIQYVTGSELDKNIDAWPKHLWSVPICHRGRPIAVFNLDTDNPILDEVQKDQLRELSSRFAAAITNYRPDKLKPLREK